MLTRSSSEKNKKPENIDLFYEEQRGMAWRGVAFNEFSYVVS
jgi:hypothetical protein